MPQQPNSTATRHHLLLGHCDPHRRQRSHTGTHIVLPLLRALDPRPAAYQNAGPRRYQTPRRLQRVLRVTAGRWRDSGGIPVDAQDWAMYCCGLSLMLSVDVDAVAFGSDGAEYVLEYLCVRLAVS